MSDKINAVLLVPADGDPNGLLREGPCGGRPPTAYTTWVDGKSDGQWRANDDSMDIEPGDALVLAWDGEPVAEGLDRLYRALHGSGCCVHFRSPAAVSAALGWSQDALRGCALVHLDSDGREVTP